MIQNDTKSLLPTVYYNMFCLRLLGFTHKQIAEKSGYSEIHVRRLFAENGALNSLWKQWLATAKKNVVEETVTLMFGNLADVARSLIDTAKRGGLNSVGASRILFAYTLGDPQKFSVPEVSQGPKTLAEFVMATTLKSQGTDEEEIKRRVARMQKLNA